MLRRPLLSRALLALTLGAALAAGVAALAEPPPGGYAPDPPGTASRKHWVIDVLHSKGRTSLLGARPVTLERPATSARMMGRFAIELYVGRELLDRVRFNVPLTGDAPEKDKRFPFRRPTFDEGVTTRMRVQIADSPRATWVKLVDRLSGAESRFWWPPDDKGRLTPMSAPPGGSTADAGASDAGARDAGGLDAGAGDAGAGNTGAGDAGARDAGAPPVDAGRGRDGG